MKNLFSQTKINFKSLFKNLNQFFSIQRQVQLEKDTKIDSILKHKNFVIYTLI